MARSAQVAITSTRATIAGPTKGGGPIIRISNPSTNPASLYIGGDENELASTSALSATTGYAIPAGSTETLILQGQEYVYGLTSTVTMTVHVFRSGG